MSFALKTTVSAAIISCLLSGYSAAQAQISPDILNLLIVTSQKKDGANLDLVAEMAIAANPDAKDSILALVANLKQNMPEAEAAAPESAPSAPTPAAEVPPPAVVDVAAETSPGFFDFSGWDGEAELNFLRSAGNTSQESLGLGSKLKRDTGLFHHTIEGFFDLNKNTGVKDKQRWGLSYKLDYDFSEKLYLTGFTGYENDQFGAFRERITTSLGIGYPIINNDSYSWKLEGGPSILFTKDLPTDSYSSSFNAFANSIFSWAINERSEFTNNTIFYYGDRAVIESKTALKVKINGALSSKFSYDLLYDRDAPLGRDKTDTVARAGILYDF